MALDRSLNYNIAVWVDYVPAANTDPAVDYIYRTTSLTTVQMTDERGSALFTTDPVTFPFIGRNFTVGSSLPLGAVDAFTEIVPFNAGSTLTTITVKRPLAKISVKAKDAAAWKSSAEIGNSNVAVSAEANFQVDNVPYKRNFITNLKGNVILNTSTFEIDVNPVFDTPDIDQAF